MEHTDVGLDVIDEVIDEGLIEVGPPLDGGLPTGRLPSMGVPNGAGRMSSGAGAGLPPGGWCSLLVVPMIEPFLPLAFLSFELAAESWLALAMASANSDSA